jgi:hypothetical protein
MASIVLASNVHVVIQWERMGLVAERSILDRQSQFLDRLGKWLRRQRKPKPLAYAWTMEFSPHKGTHTHLLLSTRLHPSGLGELGRRLPEFLGGRGVKLPPGTIEIARSCIPLPYDPSKTGWVAHTKDQRRGLIAYVIKGADPAAAEAAGINAEDHGTVRLRRCGVSRSLDWTARQRQGWRARETPEFDFADLSEKRRRSLGAALEGSWNRLRAA